QRRGHSLDLLVVASFERDRAAFAGLTGSVPGGFGAPVRRVDHGEFGADAEHEFVRCRPEVEVRLRRWRVVLFVAETGRALQQPPGAGRRQASPGDGVGVADLFGQVVQAGAADHGPLLGLLLLFGEGRGPDSSSRAHAALTCSGVASWRTAQRAVHTSPASSAYNLLAASMSVAAAAMR